MSYLRDELWTGDLPYLRDTLQPGYLPHLRNTLRHLQSARLYMRKSARMLVDAGLSDTQAWKPLVETQTSASAIDVARAVAARLRDRERLLQTNQHAIEQSRYPDNLSWNPCALAHGDAGMALACAYFDRCWPEEEWAETGALYLSHTAQAVRSKPSAAGLFAGLAGVAFAARWRRKEVPSIRELLPLIDSVARQVLEMAGRLHGRHGVAVSEVDAISGLSGIGAYLLTIRAQPPADVALQAVLETLVALSAENQGAPHWFTPYHLMGDTAAAQSAGQDNINCGLAHGIPGPLALMALALREGMAADGLAEAVARTAEWLVRRQTHDAFGVNWPTVVPLTADGRVDDDLVGSRAAWCYGAQGIARSLWLAGQVLNDAALCDLAIEAMGAVYRRPIPLRQIESPTFCHGVAGLLQVTLRFANDTDLPMFRAGAESLCRQLLGAFNSEQALGYCSIEPEGNKVDQCGVLDGAAGLTLLFASTAEAPDWDRIFLLN